MPILLEVPVFGPESAKTAVEAGASRIELNARGSYEAGGLTPSTSDLAQLQHLTVPVRVMIRVAVPQDGGRKDFAYTAEELETMKESIREIKDSGLLHPGRGDGFVFGAIAENQDGGLDIDEDAVRAMVEMARPYTIVFHRAFDAIISSASTSSSGETTSPRWQDGLGTLKTFAVDGVLTSGGLGNAAGNLDVLRQMVNSPVAHGIEIVIGGGLRSSNVDALMDGLALGATQSAAPAPGRLWMHSSCLVDRNSGVPAVGELRAILDVLALYQGA
jgi:copper homeostasis protein